MSEEKKALGLFEQMFGIDVRESLQRRTIENFRNSWAEQNRESCKTRMDYILRMAAELQDIRARGHRFATAFCEHAIEGVITGDTKEIRIWSDMLQFEGEDESHRAEWAAVFTKFRELCDEAVVAVEAAKSRPFYKAAAS